MSSLSAERHARQGGRSGSSLAGLQNPLVYLSHGLHAASKHTTRQNTVTLYVQRRAEHEDQKYLNSLCLGSEAFIQLDMVDGSLAELTSRSDPNSENRRIAIDCSSMVAKKQA